MYSSHQEQHSRVVELSAILQLVLDLRENALDPEQTSSKTVRVLDVDTPVPTRTSERLRQMTGHMAHVAHILSQEGSMDNTDFLTLRQRYKNILTKKTNMLDKGK